MLGWGSRWPSVSFPSAATGTLAWGRRISSRFLLKWHHRADVMPIMASVTMDSSSVGALNSYVMSPLRLELAPRSTAIWMSSCFSPVNCDGLSNPLLGVSPHHLLQTSITTSTTANDGMRISRIRSSMLLDREAIL